MSSLQRPAPPVQNVTLSLEQVKDALGDVLDALQSPTGAARLEEARENSGNDLGKVLQLLLPAAVQIQQEVLQNYGFSPDGEVNGEKAVHVLEGKALLISGGISMDGNSANHILMACDKGVLRFARLVKSFESQDPEIAAMSNKLKSFFLPPLPPHTGLPISSS